MAKIYAQNKAYTGVSASVPFVNGVGETDDPHLLDWFRDHGYEVEDGSAFVCPYCGKEYKTEDGLTKHMAKEHPSGEENKTPPEGENQENKPE